MMRMSGHAAKFVAKMSQEKTSPPKKCRTPAAPAPAAAAPAAAAPAAAAPPRQQQAQMLLFPRKRNPLHL